MRGVIPVLVLILAACSTAGGDTTTTTAPPADPTTTTTTAAPTTTTTAPTTTSTTTGDECVDPDGDGVLRNQRGFVCPPHLRAATGGTDVHLPGEYQSRLFQPKLRFTRIGQFRSSGENSEALAFDTVLPTGHPIPDLQVLSISDHETAARIPNLQALNHPDGWQWVTDLDISDIEVGGFPATLTRFIADCPEPDLPDTDPRQCSFDEPEGLGWSRRVFDGQWTAVIVVELPSGPFTIIAYDVFGDTGYWTEVVQPILDSIEFLDQ